MKKSISKIFIGFFLALVFSNPANAADQSRVILDQLLTGPVPALSAKDLNIPPDLSPGFHELTVEIYDDKGVISTKTALFCKTKLGELHFDNICPDLLEKPKPKPQAFDPLNNVEETLSFFAIVLALLGFLIGVGNKSDGNADLGGVEAGELYIGRKELGWGDCRRYTRVKLFNFLDKAPISMARQLEKVSTILARIVLDARYLRVIFTNLAWFTIPAALTLSYMGLHQIKNQSLPFSFVLTLSIILIGVFDSFAGFAAAFLYLDFLFANGNLFSKNSILFALGYSLLFFAPALIASKFRPLHRAFDKNEDWWVRLTDYVLAALFTGWSTTGLIRALNSQFGYELKITTHAHQIGVYVGLAIVVRMLLEEFAWRLYPKRVRSLHYQLKPAGIIKKIRSFILKVGLVIYFAYPYIGWNNYLYIGLGILFFPQLLSFFAKWLPKTKYLNYLLPKGSLKFAVLGIGGIYLALYLGSLKYSDRNLLLNSFIYLPIPAAACALLENFNQSQNFQIGLGRSYLQRLLYKYSFRFMSVIVLILIAILLSGHNPVHEIYQAFQNPQKTWHSLIYKWWPLNQNILLFDGSFRG